MGQVKNGKYRVGVLTNIPTPYRLALFRRLASSPTIELHVAFNASSEGNRFWQFEQDDIGFNFTVLPGRTFSFAGKDFLSVHLNIGVTKWIDDNVFDVVILGGWSQPSQVIALHHCRSRGIPVVFWSGSIAGKMSPSRQVSRLAMKHFIGRAAAYIAYGSDAADYLASLGASRDKIHKAYNTVDLNWWSSQVQRVNRADARKDLGISDEVVFLFVGQLVERKGVRQLVEAVCKMRSSPRGVRLLIAGSGPLAAELRDMIAASGGDSRVILLGHVPTGDLPRLYAVSDIVVLPSTYEVWGLVVNEAMASGRPVVATRSVGASRDLIAHDENGWIIMPDDASSLKGQLEVCAFLDPGTLQRLGQRAKSTVFERFSLDVAVSAIEEAVYMAMCRP